MLTIALKMLIGNRASCIGVIFGIFLATLLISQQTAIFLGLLSRSYRMVTDIPAPNLWVMDPATESDEKARDISEGYLDVVRSISGVEWAVPISVTHIPVTSQQGAYEISQLYGIDDATLIGAPIQMLKGEAKNLRREGGIIVDVYSAKSVLAKTSPDGTKVPLDLGDEVEINNHRAVVVGICKVTQGFYPQPIIFTSFNQFQQFLSSTTKRLEFIAVRTSPEADMDQVIQKINSYPGMRAYTRYQFKWKIIDYFLKTGILINFGLSVALGIIIGFSIAGQTFYIMTLENLKYYALIKAIGGSYGMIFKMIVVQALLAGVIGFALGTGVTILWGMAVKETTLAFLFPWQLLAFTAVIVLIICAFTIGVSIRKVMSTDPKVLMET